MGRTMILGLAVIAGTVFSSGAARAAEGNQLIFSIAEYGVLGICVAALTYAVIKKDKQVNTLYLRLIEKSERDAQKYQELSVALNDTLKELIDLHK